MMPLGRTGEPPFVTRTDATTVDPAFGLAGRSLTALAVAATDPPPPLPPPLPPPPLPPPPPVDSLTTIVICDALFDEVRVGIERLGDLALERVRPVSRSHDVPEPTEVVSTGDGLEIAGAALTGRRRARALLGRVRGVGAPAQPATKLDASRGAARDGRNERDIQEDVEVAGGDGGRSAVGDERRSRVALIGPDVERDVGCSRSGARAGRQAHDRQPRHERTNEPPHRGEPLTS